MDTLLRLGYSLLRKMLSSRIQPHDPSRLTVSVDLEEGRKWLAAHSFDLIRPGEVHPVPRPERLSTRPCVEKKTDAQASHVHRSAHLPAAIYVVGIRLVRHEAAIKQDP